jgi:hypothetical protein
MKGNRARSGDLQTRLGLEQDRAESELQEPARLLIEAQTAWAASLGLGMDCEPNENDADAPYVGDVTGESQPETVEKGLWVLVSVPWCP